MSLQAITKDLLDFAYRQYQQNSQQQDNNQIHKLTLRVIDRVRDQLDILTQSLQNCLLHNVQKGQFGQAKKTLLLILHLIHRILKPAEVKQMAFPIFKVIVMSYQKTMWSDRQYMKCAFEVALDMLDKHIQIFSDIGENFRDDQMLIKHIEMYECLIKKIHNGQDQLQNDLAYLNKVQVKLYHLFGVYNQKWTDILIETMSLKNPQYFLSPIQVIGEGLQKEGKLREQLLKRSQIQKNNYIEHSISKLWNIVSLAHLQGKAVPLILKLSKYFPHYFSLVLERQFQLNNQMCIIKFSLFWKLSPKYPKILTQQHLAQICKVGLFRMLNFLDNDNPLIKYNTNIWINESFPHNCNRVLDPLLQIMLKPKDFWYRTPKGQFVYAINPDNNKLLTTLKQLNSVIKHTLGKFQLYAILPITLNIKPYYHVFNDESSLDQNYKVMYLKLIFEVMVRFILSKYVCIDNPGIDLIACQILQVIIRSINKSDCLKVIKQNIKDIILALHFATKNSQHLLQIQVLNLLKIVLFESGLRRQRDNQFMIDLVSSPVFINTILEGLDTSFPYIKQRFVQFISFSIPLFLEYHTHCSQLISHLTNLYTTKINVINSKKVEESETKDIQISRKNAEILILFGGIKQILSYFLNLQVKKFQKEKSQTDTDSGKFSWHSWKSYLTLKIQKKQYSSRAKKYIEEISNQLADQLWHILLAMTSCWTLSQLSKYYRLTPHGIKQFNHQDFHQFNKQLEVTINKYQTEQTVETFIIDLIRVLINKYPRQVFNSLIQIWASASTIQAKLKIIQILNISLLPVQTFYSILVQALGDRPPKKRKSHQLQILPTAQVSLLHFCHIFTYYKFQHRRNTVAFEVNNLTNVWLSFTKFLKLFQSSKSILTFFALIELLELFTKKNNPKEILRDQRLKKDFVFIGNQLIDLIGICGGKIKILNPIDNLPHKAFLPFPSSLIDIMCKTTQNQQEKYPWLFFQYLPTDKAPEYMRIQSLAILRRVGYPLLHTFFGDSEVNQIKKIRELLTLMLSMVDDKSLSPQLIEWASEIIDQILSKKTIFFKQFKNEILYLFNKDDFFICSSKTLRKWAKIIDGIIQINKDHDIFSQYLDKVSLVSSIFSSYTSETKKKIKSFQRICFILYARQKDKLIDKAHLLIDKIIQVIKNNEAPQPVLILIFFCIRILILRVSPDKLTKLLSNVWQLVMYLLLNIFKKCQLQKDRNQLNLVWAALKLVQMVSIMEMSQFHPHQWMFFYDFVGIKFSSSPQSHKQLEFKSKPLIQRYLPNVLPYKDQVSEEVSVRHLIIKQDKIDDLQLLKTKALSLSVYLVASNENKMNFDMQEIQELIENDFLNLDEFIYKFK